LEKFSKLLHDRIGDLIRATGLEGPVEEGENIVAVALFDDQIPVYSLGNQRPQLGALFRVHSGAADEEVYNFSGDGHNRSIHRKGAKGAKKDEGHFTTETRRAQRIFFFFCREIPAKENRLGLRRWSLGGACILHPISIID